MKIPCPQESLKETIPAHMYGNLCDVSGLFGDSVGLEEHVI
jgi:hypothetical protein